MRTSTARTSVFLGTLLATLLATAVAVASDEDDARDAMRRGVAAFARGDATTALAEYEAAKKLAPAANAPYRYAAEALASLGRWKEVVENLEQYIAKNPSVSDAEEMRARIAKVKAEHYPGRLRVESTAPGARVTIDAVDKGLLPGAFELPAGKHHVAVTADGKKEEARDVDVVGESEQSVSFELGDLPPPTPSTGEGLAPGTPAGSSPLKTIGWVGIGVGAATFLTALVLDGAVLGPKISDYRAAADRGDPTARDLHGSVKGLQAGVLVTYVVGAVIGIAGGMTLLAAPTVGKNHAGISARIAF